MTDAARRQMIEISRVEDGDPIDADHELLLGRGEIINIAHVSGPQECFTLLVRGPDRDHFIVRLSPLATAEIKAAIRG